MTLNECIRKIRKNHFFREATGFDDVNEWEKRYMRTLPADLRKFYGQFYEVRLFLLSDSPYHILPITNVRPTNKVMYGTDDPELGSRYVFALIFVWDGNYVAMDLRKDTGKPQYVDAFCETFHGDWKNPRIITTSFTEFLSDALQSKGKHYWLGK
jgi:hypothetical protein